MTADFDADHLLKFPMARGSNHRYWPAIFLWFGPPFIEMEGTLLIAVAPGRGIFGPVWRG